MPVRIVAADGSAGGTPGGRRAGLLEVAGPSLMAACLDDGHRGHPHRRFPATGGIGFAGRQQPVYLARAGVDAGGFLVSPREVEAFLEDEPAVDRAQVVAADTPDGPRAVGFVTLNPGAVLDEVSVLARGRAVLARYKVPVRVFPVDAFPTTESANGMKIQRARLREEAGRRLAAD
jgi:fatty-acyl-CoA synthase